MSDLSMPVLVLIIVVIVIAIMAIIGYFMEKAQIKKEENEKKVVLENPTIEESVEEVNTNKDAVVLDNPFVNGENAEPQVDTSTLLYDFNQPQVEVSNNETVINNEVIISNEMEGVIPEIDTTNKEDNTFVLNSSDLDNIKTEEVDSIEVNQENKSQSVVEIIDFGSTNDVNIDN